MKNLVLILLSFFVLSVNLVSPIKKYNKIHIKEHKNNSMQKGNPLVINVNRYGEYKNSYKIQVATNDMKMFSKKALKMYSKKDGWRLPTKEELVNIYIQLFLFGNKGKFKKPTHQSWWNDGAKSYFCLCAKTIEELNERWNCTNNYYEYGEVRFIEFCYQYQKNPKHYMIDHSSNYTIDVSDCVSSLHKENLIDLKNYDNILGCSGSIFNGSNYVSLTDCSYTLTDATFRLVKTVK